MSAPTPVDGADLDRVCARFCGAEWDGWSPSQRYGIRSGVLLVINAITASGAVITWPDEPPAEGGGPA